MPNFSYKAIDNSGKEISGAIEAASHTDAIRMIREKGLFPTRVVEEKEVLAESGGIKESKNIEIKIPFLAGMAVNQKLIIQFTRQLSTLISAGLPLVRSLNVLHNQAKDPALKKTTRRLAEEVEGGSTFSEALGKFPHTFDHLYVSTVRAGESGGVLEVVLTRLADYAEKSARLKSRIISALAYPILVTLFAVMVLVILIVVVVPKFIEIFKDIGAELPILTVFLLKLSDFMKTRWYLVIAFLIGLVILYQVLIRIPKVRYVIDNIKLHLPLFGQLLQKVTIAGFARTLGTLISSGVPILQAMKNVEDTTSNAVISRAISRVHDSIQEGETIAAPLEASGVFPLMVVNMIDVGEETGALDQMLTKIADTYEDEVDTTVSALTSLLEPMLILVMGVVVGFIVIAMFLPLVSLITTLGGM